MKWIGIGVGALVVVGFVAAMGGGSSETPEKSAESKELGSVSSVVELRDALVDAGFECPNWNQDNVVDLAAESGSCDDDSVLSTFASEGDKQAQLDTFREMDVLFTDADIELDPFLVGPNWIVRVPDAADYVDQLGGTVVGSESG